MRYILVGGLEHFFPIQLGISWSQMTNSIIFQRGRSTTNLMWFLKKKMFFNIGDPQFTIVFNTKMAFHDLDDLEVAPWQNGNFMFRDRGIHDFHPWTIYWYMGLVLEHHPTWMSPLSLGICPIFITPLDNGYFETTKLFGFHRPLGKF